MSALLPNLLLFGRVLRGLGLDVDVGRMIDLVEALGHVGIGSRADFRHAARSLLVRRREDLALFDAAFDAFWRKPPEGSTGLDLRALGEQRRFRRPRFSPVPLRRSESDDPAPPASTVVRPILTWSPLEVLRHKDFAELTADEAEDVRHLLKRLRWRVRPRRTRRFRTGRGPALDLRRTLRRAFRHGGEVLTFARRERRTRPRRVVVLADISGSMERYTRLLLLFVRGLAEGFPRTEAFVFGTRLTRITRPLLAGDLERALADVARAVPDWSGGTRIGETLRTFNLRWARRVLSGGAVVLLISDGWDRGDPALLGEEMARLQRTSHRLIWLNPLLGAPDYEPKTRGLEAALPFVDDFLPVHHLANLEDLARHLERLPSRRAGRRQHPPRAAARA